MIPTFFLGELLEQITNLPDSDIEQINKMNAGEYKYDIWDMLYFSAITITTLGYGDILPSDVYKNSGYD